MKKDKLDNQIKKTKSKMPMVFYLTMFIFGVSSITAMLIFCIFVWLLNMGVIEGLNFIGAGVLLLIGSIIISTSLVRGLGNKIIFRSLMQINDATKAVAEGDFSQRLEVPKEKETAEICENFNEMVDKLGNNELLARDFVSNVSHQFRTPLASIHGYVQLLENENISSAERLEYTSIIKDKAISLSELVNDILELSRLEYQSAAITKENFSLDEQLRKCVLGMENELNEKNIEINMDLESVKYFGSKDLLNEVWNNLIENAIKFSDSDSAIDIVLKDNSSSIFVSVKDNGIGMSSETRNRLFDRFYRGSEAYSRPGSGLGMSMVKSILIKHGGDIKVNSELGQGSEFIVELPVVS